MIVRDIGQRDVPRLPCLLGVGERLLKRSRRRTHAVGRGFLERLPGLGYNILGHLDQLFRLRHPSFKCRQLRDSLRIAQPVRLRAAKCFVARRASPLHLAPRGRHPGAHLREVASAVVDADKVGAPLDPC